MEYQYDMNRKQKCLGNWLNKKPIFLSWTNIGESGVILVRASWNSEEIYFLYIHFAIEFSCRSITRIAHYRTISYDTLLSACGNKRRTFL